MATIADIKPQPNIIKNLVIRLKESTGGTQAIEWYLQTPELQQAFLDQLAPLRTKRFFLYGYKEDVEARYSVPNIYPTMAQVMTRSEAWLSVGDVILGWGSGLIEADGSPNPSARIVEERIPSGANRGYKWRYVGSQEIRNPVKLNRWFQDIGWELLGPNSETVVDDIYTVQSEEITMLNEQIDYFEGRHYMDI